MHFEKSVIFFFKVAVITVSEKSINIFAHENFF